MIYCIQLDKTDTAFHLAVEEMLLKESPHDFFLIYVNPRSVVCGKHQNVMREINFPLIHHRQIPVFRRITGGGTVFHDEGNINYCFIRTNSGNNKVDFEFYASFIIDFLQSLGLNAQLGLRHEIVCGGYKISGTAMHVFRDRVIHHGTLLFNTDLDLLNGIIRPNQDSFHDMAVNSVRSEVANISTLYSGYLGISEFIHALFRHVSDRLPYSTRFFLQSNQIEKAQKLADEKYHSWEWTWAYHGDYEFEVEWPHLGRLMLQVRNGVIESVQNISAGEIPYVRFSNAVTGIRHEPAALINALSVHLANHDKSVGWKDEIVNYLF